jgi:hypothetical protein
MRFFTRYLDFAQRHPINNDTFDSPKKRDLFQRYRLRRMQNFMDLDPVLLTIKAIQLELHANI